MSSNRKRVFRQACREIEFAPGWNKRRLLFRTYEICAIVRLNSEQGIPMDRRRRIWRLAGDILLEEKGGVPGFWNEMGDLLAGHEPDWRTVPQAQRSTKLLLDLEGLGGLTPEFLTALRTRAASEHRCFATSHDRGGDWRSGEHSLRSTVLRMAVRLYCEAHASPGGSVGGPSFRFANAIRELTSDEPEPFSACAVRAEFRRIKPKAKRTRGLQPHLLYTNTLYRQAIDPAAPAPKPEPDPDPDNA
jgi:hypothetical protein